jgi:hypothetical protein
VVRALRLFIFIVTLAQVPAQASSLRSAVREHGSSYLAYKSVASLFAQRPFGFLTPKTASDSAVTYDPQTLPAVTEWNSVAEMTARFEKIRDLRWLTTTDHPGFLRRSSWLYPDDGCFARAGLAIMNLAKITPAIPNKIFVFGDLTVLTANSTTGTVEWWYHVAPIVQVQGQKYVLDPALSPRAPIKLEDWLALMSNDIHSLQVAICNSGSYAPDDACDHVTDGIEATANDDQYEFLDNEWSRLVDLKRNPLDELGDKPPWLSPLLPVAGF